MQHSIKQELTSHLIDTANERFDEDSSDFSELHFYAFNEDYYIVYHSASKSWLARHEIDAFEAISDIIEWETETLGEVTLNAQDINPEKIVNLYVYMKGEELISELLGDIDLNDTTKEDVLSALSS